MSAVREEASAGLDGYRPAVNEVPVRSANPNVAGVCWWTFDAARGMKRHYARTVVHLRATFMSTHGG